MFHILLHVAAGNLNKLIMRDVVSCQCESRAAWLRSTRVLARDPWWHLGFLGQSVICVIMDCFCGLDDYLFA